MRLAAGHVGRQRGEVELDVGRRRFRQHAREEAALVDADRERPAARAAATAGRCCTERHHELSSSLVVIGLRALGRSGAPAGDPAGSRRRRAGRATTGMPSCCSSAAGPMPESCSSCGLCSAPAESITSRARAHAASSRRPARYSTPTARVPSNRTRVACASVSHRRLARARAGRGSRPRCCSASPFRVMSW